MGITAEHYRARNYRAKYAKYIYFYSFTILPHINYVYFYLLIY